jgi:hypothetical protein
MKAVRRIRLVAPFKPCPLETHTHQTLGADFWMGALSLLNESAQISNNVSVFALTDQTSHLPIPTLRYDTTETRLMLWLLEVCVAYLRSDNFDRDTVMLDVDQLIVKDLRPYFTEADLAVCLRKPPRRPNGMRILNGVQFWRHRGKAQLIAFYEFVLETARTMSEGSIRWGADGFALRDCLEPLENNYHVRHGCRVAFLPATNIIEEWTSQHQREALNGRFLCGGPRRPVLDFRNRRKYDGNMQVAFDLWRRTFPLEAVPA